MATNGTTNGVPQIDGDSQTNGVSASQNPAETNGFPQANGPTHNLVAKGHSRKPSSYSAKHKIAPHFIGGNHLGVAPASSVKDFVANNDGHSVISNVRKLPGALQARIR
ncbi:MAG: hypothetical protein Q9205_002306 [Flavoplaca limonia]